MVTFLRPFPHAHGPAAVNVRLGTRRSRHQQPSSSLPCRWSNLRPMAQDPSHPHRQSKEQDTPPTSQQELTQQLPPAPSSPPRDVQEPSTSSSTDSSSDTSSWLKLGIGQSPGSTSPSSSSRRKRPRQNYEAAGPSTSIQPAAPQPDLGLSLFPLPASSFSPSSASAVAVAAAPPPAHEAGTWFVLQAAQNQRREPPLPQIPRSYLRVRDGRITVRVVMRYLVNKLGLEDDSQLDITCRGQSLLPVMTLQHVRDTIWRPPPAEAAAVLPAPGSSSMNQVMTLHYGRS